MNGLVVVANIAVLVGLFGVLRYLWLLARDYLAGRWSHGAHAYSGGLRPTDNPSRFIDGDELGTFDGVRLRRLTVEDFYDADEGVFFDAEIPADLRADDGLRVYS